MAGVGGVRVIHVTHGSNVAASFAVADAVADAAVEVAAALARRSI